MINPGKFMYRVDWYQYSLSDTNNYGEKAETFTFQKTLWVAFDKLKPNERFYWGGLQTAVDLTVTVNGDLDIDNKDEFRTEDYIYKIIGVVPDFGETICYCTRINR